MPFFVIQSPLFSLRLMLPDECHTQHLKASCNPHRLASSRAVWASWMQLSISEAQTLSPKNTQTPWPVPCTASTTALVRLKQRKISNRYRNFFPVCHNQAYQCLPIGHNWATIMKLVILLICSVVSWCRMSTWKRNCSQAGFLWKCSILWCYDALYYDVTML